MKMIKSALAVILVLCFAFGSEAQRYTQSGTIHTDIQLFSADGVAINGHSREMHIEYPVGEPKMVITIDPHTLLTDNIEFNQQMQEALLGNFVFVAEVDPSKFEYQSKYNEKIEVEAEATINNITGIVKILLIVNNKKTTNQNVYVIVGSGQILLDDYELKSIFPNVRGPMTFQFTQNLTATYR